MAQKITQVLVNDITGETMDADEGVTVEFGIDGKTLEVDLYEDQATELRDLLAPYIAAGRRVGGRVKKTTRTTPSGGTGYSREQSAEIRRWGRENGWEVSDRGRIKTELAEAWEKAHQGSAA